MPGVVDSKVGESSGKALGESLLNLMPADSTNLRGGEDPIRAMMRAQRMRDSPSAVSTVSQPGSTSLGEVWVRTVTRPASRACIRFLTLASLALAKSAERLRIATTLAW